MQSQNTLIKSVEKEHLGTIDLGDGYPWKTASIDIVDFHLYRRETREGNLLSFTITFSAGDRKASLSIALETTSQLVIFKAGIGVDETNRENKMFCCLNVKNLDSSCTIEATSCSYKHYTLGFLLTIDQAILYPKSFALNPTEQLYDIYAAIAGANHRLFGEQINIVSVSYDSNFD